jgi:O-antigen biosynthesis protein
VRRALAFSQQRFGEQLAQVVARAEADLAQGLNHQQVASLREAAQVAMPGYQVRSGAPVVGPLIARVRRQLTAHLREPYLDPILARQEAYNQRLLDTLLPVLERSLRSQQRLERQVRLLEQHIQHLRAEIGESEGA